MLLTQQMEVGFQRPQQTNELRQLGLRHAFVLSLGVLLYFCLMDYSTESASTRAVEGTASTLKFYTRVLPMAATFPLLFLLDYSYCGFGGLRRLFSFPAIAITFYLTISILASFQGAEMAVAMWKAFEAGTCFYWAAVASEHAHRYGFPSPLAKLMILPLCFAVYALSLAMLFPAESFEREMGAALPVLICLLPYMAFNYLAFEAVYGLICVQTNIGISRWSPLFRVALFLIVGVVVLITQTRSAWLAVTIAYLASGFGFLAAGGWSLRMSHQQWVYLSIGLMAMGLGTLYVLKSPEGIVNFLARGQDAEKLSELSGRSVMWKIAVSEIRKRPLLGSGISVATRNVNQGSEYKSDLLKINKKWMSVTPNLHNSNLEILMNSGIVGGLPYILLLLVWLPINSIRAVCSRQPDSLLAGMLGLTLMVQSTALSTLSQGTHAFLFLCLLVFNLRSPRKFSVGKLEFVDHSSEESRRN